MQGFREVFDELMQDESFRKEYETLEPEYVAIRKKLEAELEEKGGNLEFELLQANVINYIGEATEYERKQAVERRKVKNWLKCVSAFANTAGGILIFGVADDGKIVGLNDIKSDSEFVSQKIKERIVPFPEVLMKLHKTETGKDLLILKVVAGTEPPYFYSGDGVMEAHIRIGNECVVADPPELKRMVIRGKNISYDSLISSYRYEDFSFTKLRERYRTWTGKSMTEKNFDSFGIRNEEGYLTNAGVLLADDSPMWWSRVFCTRWNGLNKSGGQIDALDSAVYTGSIIMLFNDSMRFIKRNMKTLWKKAPSSRIEMPDYCERSIVEALVNALIHRDYMIYGSEVHVDMFDDRLVITSPGGMPNGKQIQDCSIDEVVSIRRNPVLADIFDRLGYMERQGSGLSKIRDAYEFAANYQPELAPVFRSDHADFTVVLRNLNYDQMKDDTRNGTRNDTGNDTRNDAENGILELIRSNPQITLDDLSKILPFSRSTVARLTRKMQKEGRLERVGATKKGEWIVKD